MIVLEQKSTGRLIGQVTAVINKNKTGWVSMFIVEEEFRGKGLGRPLFKAVMTDLERNGTEIIGLDGVPEQVGTCKCSSSCLLVDQRVFHGYAQAFEKLM
jgi:GNAT superfamily N-acetyltransferase